MGKLPEKQLREIKLVNDYKNLEFHHTTSPQGTQKLSGYTSKPQRENAHLENPIRILINQKHSPRIPHFPKETQSSFRLQYTTVFKITQCPLPMENLQKLINSQHKN